MPKNTPSQQDVPAKPKPTLSRGLTILTIATVVAGLAGYLVTWLVYRRIGPAPYALFAVFWSAMYLLIGGVSGVQQEVTRSSHPRMLGDETGRGRARKFAILVATLVAVVISASSPLWAPLAFGQTWLGFIWPLAVSVSTYVVVAVISGSLYGVSRWGTLGLMISIDAVLRLVLVGGASFFTDEALVLAWCAAAPVALTPLILWPLLHRGLFRRVSLDVDVRQLTWNSARTVLAAFAMAVLVSGFPLVLGMTSTGESPALLGELIFVITLTRAPLIILMTAFQSMLVVQFRDNKKHVARVLGRITVIVSMITLVLGLAGYFAGKPVFELITGHSLSVSGLFIAILVVSSALVALMTMAGSALLAQSAHLSYTLGWVIAALFTIAMLLVPVGTISRVSLALIVAPSAGVLSQLLGLVLRRRNVSVRAPQDVPN